MRGFAAGKRGKVPRLQRPPAICEGRVMKEGGFSVSMPFVVKIPSIVSCLYAQVDRVFQEG